MVCSLREGHTARKKKRDKAVGQSRARLLRENFEQCFVSFTGRILGLGIGSPKNAAELLLSSTHRVMKDTGREEADYSSMNSPQQISRVRVCDLPFSRHRQVCTTARANTKKKANKNNWVVDDVDPGMNCLRHYDPGAHGAHITTAPQALRVEAQRVLGDTRGTPSCTQQGQLLQRCSVAHKIPPLDRLLP